MTAKSLIFSTARGTLGSEAWFRLSEKRQELFRGVRFLLDRIGVHAFTPEHFGDARDDAGLVVDGEVVMPAGASRHSFVTPKRPWTTLTSTSTRR